MKAKELLRNTRFLRAYDADPHYMWDKPAAALRHARAQRRLPHPCQVFERVYTARHGTDTRARNTYMERIQRFQLANDAPISAFGFWRPKDRLHVTLPDGTITLRAYVS